MDNLTLLVRELLKHPTETLWLEFKHNNDDPKMIGEDISALANAAALCEKSCAYMIWGIENGTHAIVGTTFDYRVAKKGNEEIQTWLRKLLSSNANFEFAMTSIDGKPIVVLTIYKAVDKTVMFEKIDFIRIGSYTKKLNDFPQVKTQLWDKLRNAHFETLSAKFDLTSENVLKFLDYSTYFDIKNEALPSSHEGILHYLIEEAIISRQDNGLYSITNLGAVLFAKKLDDFPSVARKALRIVQYKGKDRLDMLKEDVGKKGYAYGFEGLLKYIEALLPASEVIEGAVRKTISAYPMIAIRESVANALIHQDFSISGTGPVIELFNNRIEITNPGVPLIDVQRIIDNPPKSRNERLASLMRRLKMCEELGTGWDKIVISCEAYQLPAPKIDLYEENTKVSLFVNIPYSDISLEDRMRACYQHACLKQIQGEQANNTSLRERFGLEATAMSSISRLIRDSVNAGFIKPYDPNTAPRHMKYVPFWA
ncbi:transcriptional regulator [Synergistales bacterium]|nr:transcriptional regulator [Synergistales bacterium]